MRRSSYNLKIRRRPGQNLRTVRQIERQKFKTPKAARTFQKDWGVGKARVVRVSSSRVKRV